MIIIPAGVLDKHIAAYFFQIFTRLIINAMDNNKNETNKSRRSFFSGLLNLNKEKVKMLTADGKLVEVDKAVLDAATKQKVTNKEILEWMNNPSKNETEI